jgi:hypothetical protein
MLGGLGLGGCSSSRFIVLTGVLCPTCAVLQGRTCGPSAACWSSLELQHRARWQHSMVGMLTG